MRKDVEDYKFILEKEINENNGVVKEDSSVIINKIDNGDSFVVFKKDNTVTEVKENKDFGSIDFKVIEEGNEEDYVFVFGDIGSLSNNVIEKSVIYTESGKIDINKFITSLKSNIGDKVKIREQSKLGPVEWMSGVLPFYFDIIDEEKMK